MVTVPAVDLDYCLDLLLRLLAIPSPSGQTEALTAHLEVELADLGVETRRTPKGALLWTLQGDEPIPRAVAAHVDTLGAMVRRVKENGRLEISRIGGYDWATIEGAECLVHLAGGGDLCGTVVSTRQSVHAFERKEREHARSQAAGYEIRLDIPAASAEAVAAAGVEVGDFVSFDSGARLTENGFVKGRHLDDKAAVALMVAATRALLREDRKPATDTHFFLSNFEEVGHGAAGGLPDGTSELLCLDMAVVGEGQNSDEHSVTLCAKDAGGPYDPVMGSAIRSLAREHRIPLKVDLYPNYTSDATAAWRAGASFRAALIGPGVDASHGYERTHRDAVEATARLLLAWLTTSTSLESDRGLP